MSTERPVVKIYCHRNDGGISIYLGEERKQPSPENVAKTAAAMPAMIDAEWASLLTALNYIGVSGIGNYAHLEVHLESENVRMAALGLWKTKYPEWAGMAQQIVERWDIALISCPKAEIVRRLGY